MDSSKIKKVRIKWLATNSAGSILHMQKWLSPTVCTCVSGFLCFLYQFDVQTAPLAMIVGIAVHANGLRCLENFWDPAGVNRKLPAKPTPYLLEDGGITCLAITVQLHGDFTSQPVLPAARHENSRPPHIIDVKVLSCSMSIFLRSGMWN